MVWKHYVLICCFLLSGVSTRRNLKHRHKKIYVGKEAKFKCLPGVPKNHTVIGLTWILTGYHKVDNFVDEKPEYDAQVRISLRFDDTGAIQGLLHPGRHKSYLRYFFQRKRNKFVMLIRNAKLDDAGDIACIVKMNNDATDKRSTITKTWELSVLPDETPVKLAKEGEDVFIPCRVPYVPKGWIPHWVQLYYYSTNLQRSHYIYGIRIRWNLDKKHDGTFNSTKYELMRPDSYYTHDLKIKHTTTSDAGYYVCNVKMEKIHYTREDDETDKNYYFPTQLKINGTQDKKQCRCSKPKHLLSKNGDTLFTNGLNCGSRVEWRCSNQSEPVYEEPISFQKCVDGKWEPDFQGLPWCVFYTSDDPCEEYDNRKLCKQGSTCLVDGETSDATCGPCKPYTTGYFCEEKSDEYCNIHCKNGNCTYHEDSDYFTCACHEGWIGYGCSTSIEAVCAYYDGVSSGGKFCKNGGTCMAEYHHYTTEAMCLCPENTTGHGCETLLQ
ncbi:unnamed protein product [Owenia fusiformis]|uniref:Uncharacterized protein n=1 Tax=Owenia fusiformis TaxID=6347 RepID=A0A8J1XYX2_OWEFU|nr:unnamed protein product [Owenia fusiformis]